MSDQARRRRQEGGRPHRITVRFSDAEKALATTRADQLGVSLQRLLVEAALAGDTRTATERRAVVSELLGVRRLVAAIGNNVNQIARIANSTGRVPEEVTAAAEAVLRALARLDEAASALGSS